MARLVLLGFGEAEELVVRAVQTVESSNNAFFVVRAFHSLHGRSWGWGGPGGKGYRVERGNSGRFRSRIGDVERFLPCRSRLCGRA